MNAAAEAFVDESKEPWLRDDDKGAIAGQTGAIQCIQMAKMHRPHRRARCDAMNELS